MNFDAAEAQRQEGLIENIAIEKEQVTLEN